MKNIRISKLVIAMVLVFAFIANSFALIASAKDNESSEPCVSYATREYALANNESDWSSFYLDYINQFQLSEFEQKALDLFRVVNLLIDSYGYYEVSDEDKLNYMMAGLMNSIQDKYSYFYTKEKYDKMLEENEGEYSGVGITFSQSSTSNEKTVVRIAKESPAYNSGILPGDVLYKVGKTDVSNMILDEVASMIRGKENTKVKLTVKREGVKKPLQFVITRAKIKYEYVSYKMLDNSIGYIELYDFGKFSSNQFIEAINNLEKQGMKGLVLDLRDNGGGYVDEAIAIADRILPTGLATYTIDRDGTRQDYNLISKEKINVPMAVLINGNSASATEILAGAIKDYGAGKLIGTTSFGKGIGQYTIPTGLGGTAINLTNFTFYSPKGNTIHKVGIEPDIKVDLSDEAKKMLVKPVNKDAQLKRAIKYLKKKMK